jgi:hypothetical protein
MEDLFEASLFQAGAGSIAASWLALVMIKREAGVGGWRTGAACSLCSDAPEAGEGGGDVRQFRA